MNTPCRQNESFPKVRAHGEQSKHFGLHSSFYLCACWSICRYRTWLVNETMHAQTYVYWDSSAHASQYVFIKHSNIQMPPVYLQVSVSALSHIQLWNLPRNSRFRGSRRFITMFHKSATEVSYIITPRIIRNWWPTRCNFFGLFISTQSVLHVSGDVFAHHQEHLTVFTASDIVHLCCSR